MQDAAEASVSVKETNDKVVIMGEAFALYRERVAQDYVKHAQMQALEARLITAIREAATASTVAINALTQRIDRQLDKP